MDSLLRFLAFAIPAVFAITVHEVAHGWVASRLGDPTAARAGRLSLNPLRHIDPVGTVLVPALIYLTSGGFFGWARPVPVDWRYLRRPRFDMGLVAAAGPLSNLLMLIAWLILMLRTPTGTLLSEMSWTGISFNATIMVLNLLPLPPLDGSRIVAALLPARLAAPYARIEPYGLLILAGLLMSGFLGRILGPLVRGVVTGLATLLASS
jgi:Zn-dependent protease